MVALSQQASFRGRLTYNIEPSSRPDRTGRTSIMIRIHQKGEKPGRVLTTVKLEKLAKHWNPRKAWGKWIIRHIDADALNAEILNEYNRIRDQAEAWLKKLTPGQRLTPLQLADRFRGEVSARYFFWIDKVLEDAKALSYATYLTKRTVVNDFRKWIGEDIPLDGITIDLANRYRTHLQHRKSETNGQPLKAVSINKYIERLGLLHEQVLIKTGTRKKEAALLSPWAELEPLKESKSKKIKLHEDTIEKLGEMKIESRRRVVTPESAFRIWMLAHFLAGARFSDVLLLRYYNFTVDEQGRPVHLRYEMSKTGFVVNIPLLEQAQELLLTWWNPKAAPTDFVIPLLKSSAPYARIMTYEEYKTAPFELKHARYNALTHWNRQINECLREVEQKAGLSAKLRMHNARHSFADLARRIMQEHKTITPYDIQLMMGHSTLSQTSDYMEELSGQDATQPLTAVFRRR